MTTNTPLAYPAEYYYPEFIDSRPDDPLKPSSQPPLTTSIDNGIGPPTRASTNGTGLPTRRNSTLGTQQSYRSSLKKKPPTNSHTSTSLALDVVTNQGLPDADMTKAVKTDPQQSLLRNPADKNIPRLLVDDSVIKQAVRPTRIVTTNFEENFEQTPKVEPVTQRDTKPLSNGYLNGDLTYKSKALDTSQHQGTKFMEAEQPPIDEYWKKQVHINDEGVVSIEPLKYDKETYEGPFGLTRQGSLIFYITLGIITLLAGVFIIVTAIFYSLSFPDSTTNTAKLAGAGACALVFYLGLQLILIGLWHQKYRQENPTKVVTKSSKSKSSSAHTRSTEAEQPYDYSYQQPMDYSYQQPSDYSYQPMMNYPPYEDYSNPPYTANVNQQMSLQQAGAGYPDGAVWPSNVEIETQPDSKFMQPMEWSYGPQVVNETVPPTTFGSVPVTAASTKPPKKSHRRHHNKEKTVQDKPAKSEPNNLFPNSTVTEETLPTLNKAPETTELMKTIADMEKTNQRTHRSNSISKKNSNRVKPDDKGRRTHRQHSRHHHQHRRRSYSSCSSCSTCSSRSRVDFHSDISYNPRLHYPQQSSDTMHKVITPRSYRARTPSPPRTHRSSHRDNRQHSKTTRESGVTADLEDVPNVRDDRLEQIPVVRRTIIVEPYPAQPSTQITIKPQNETTGRYSQINEENETIMYPSTSSTNKKSQKKHPKTIESSHTQKKDLTLEDVNDDANDKTTSKSKTKKPNQTVSNKGVKNAFF